MNLQGLSPKIHVLKPSTSAGVGLLFSVCCTFPCCSRPRETSASILQIRLLKSSKGFSQFIIISHLMRREDDLSNLLLPRQKVGVLTKPNGTVSKFYSNIFEVKLKKDAMNLYQYCFDFSPEIPQDSDGLIEKIARQIRDQLKKNIGLVCFRGLMAWGRKEMKTVLTCKAQFTKNGQKYGFEVLVKPTKYLGLESFMSENIENLPAISQVLNINTKQILRKEGMIELSPGSYYNTDTLNDNQADGMLSVWRGFNITVSIYNKSLYLQIDPCSRVLRDQTFLETIKGMKPEEIDMKYKGSPVLRKYGSPKIYRIEEIDYKMSPKKTFYDEKAGKEITFVEYYQRQYGVKIRNQNQPLLKVQGDRRFNKSKDEKDKHYIYLVPEMVCLTGLTDEQRCNHHIMKSLGQYTKLTAQQRMMSATKMLVDIKKDKELIFEINDTPKALDGFTLKTPQVMLGPNRATRVDKGSMNFKERVLDPIEFKDFVIVYSLGKYPKDDQADVDEAFGLLKSAGQTFGIKFNVPIYLEVKSGGDIKNWISVLGQERKTMRPEDRCDIIFFLLKPQEEKLYADLKKFVTLKFGCASQVAKRKLLSSKNGKGAMSAASKIVMQMNVKNGHALWTVKNLHAAWEKNLVAVAGLASSKGKKGTSLAFVGTTNADLNSYYSDCRQIKGRQTISAALFSSFFTPWLQNCFKKNNQKLPKTLVLYREGLNEAQARSQFELEVQGLLDTIKLVKEKTKQPGYNPVIVYLLVNKKPNSRIFEGAGKGKNISYSNPDPGSVIFEDLSQGQKGFHLASVVVREGTCTPVSFKIGYESHPDFPLEAISDLTYNQTYCYYNWMGSVRVPATLQNANKLSKLYSEIGGEITTEVQRSDLKKTLFYL